MTATHGLVIIGIIVGLITLYFVYHIWNRKRCEQLDEIAAELRNLDLDTLSERTTVNRKAKADIAAQAAKAAEANRSQAEAAESEAQRNTEQAKAAEEQAKATADQAAAKAAEDPICRFPVGGCGKK